MEEIEDCDWERVGLIVFILFAGGLASLWGMDGVIHGGLGLILGYYLRPYASPERVAKMIAPSRADV